MAIRKIVTVGGPKEAVLHAKAKKVSRFDAHLERLVADLWETMREAPGVGLAAPQIGEPLRVLVAEYEEQAVAFVNPEIIKRSDDEVLGTEGCLSIPGFVGDNVPRAESVVVKGRDPKGKEIRLRAEGWFARILQHEIDHLDGILYTDRIGPSDVRPVTDEDVDEAGTHAKGQTQGKSRGQTKQAKGERGAAMTGANGRDGASGVPDKATNTSNIPKANRPTSPPAQPSSRTQTATGPTVTQAGGSR
jgi:peptide deformylase